MNIVNYEDEKDLDKNFNRLLKKYYWFYIFCRHWRSSNEAFQKEDECMKMWKINYFANRLLVKCFVKATKVIINLLIVKIILLP